MTKNLDINDIIIRKGSLREKYNIKEKKFVNNILHYVIQSNVSNDIILSEFAIDKDFVSAEEISKNKDKKNFIKLFKSKIRKLLPIATK